MDMESISVPNDSRMNKSNSHWLEERKEDGEEYTVVKRKKTSKRPTVSTTLNENIETNRGGPNTKGNKTKTEKEMNKKWKKSPLPDAIAVRPSPGESFADILKTVRRNVNLETIRSTVTSIKESKGGELLIRLPRKETKRKELEQALASTLGSWHS